MSRLMLVSLILSLLTVVMIPLAAQEAVPDEPQEQVVLVLDDNGSGVECAVYRNAIKDDSLLGDTDSSGALRLRASCTSGVLVADPKVGSHTRGRTNCAPGEPTVEIRVTRHVYLSNLRINAELLEGLREYGRAALVNNELWIRELSAGNHNEAKAARLKVYELLAQHFNLSDDSGIRLDPQQEILVMSPELRRAVAGYQQQQDLGDQLGTVDYPTLAGIAEEDINDYLFDTLEQRQ